MDAELLVKGGIIVAILAGLWILGEWNAYRRRALRLGRALRLAAPAPPVPSGPPIERIAADARRIRSQLRQAPAELPMARLRGWIEAYDDVLVTACRSLGLEERLGELPEGPTRQLERERVERMLEATGLLLRSHA
jgi:hypothetical protein